MNNKRGFSLIELLIVVVIIGIIAAIAIPNLLAARRSANEGAVVAGLRTLHGAQMTYASTNGNRDFAGVIAAAGTVDVMTALGPDGAGVGLGPSLIDAALASGTKSGYNFVGGREAFVDGVGGAPATFFFSARPTVPTGVTYTGTRRFGVATDGVLKADPDPANVAIQFTGGAGGTLVPAPALAN